MYQEEKAPADAQRAMRRTAPSAARFEDRPDGDGLLATNTQRLAEVNSRLAAAVSRADAIVERHLGPLPEDVERTNGGLAPTPPTTIARLGRQVESAGALVDELHDVLRRLEGL